MSEAIQVVGVMHPSVSDVPAITIVVEPGLVIINGAKFLPHEAAQLSRDLYRAEWLALNPQLIGLAV